LGIDVEWRPIPYARYRTPSSPVDEQDDDASSKVGQGSGGLIQEGMEGGSEDEGGRLASTVTMTSVTREEQGQDGTFIWPPLISNTIVSYHGKITTNMNPVQMCRQCRDHHPHAHQHHHHRYAAGSSYLANKKISRRILLVPMYACVLWVSCLFLVHIQWNPP
jgi:hypothetical protein